jgi:multicomponent Na+:H+ antiporter subunit E
VNKTIFRPAVLTLILFVLWVLMSGMFTPFLLAAGLGSSIAVSWMAHRMGLLQSTDAGLQRFWGSVGYLLWLLLEIIKSSWVVTRIILHPSLPISPTLVRFRPTQKTLSGLVIHANSITLTPGTYTIEAGLDSMLVHGLTSTGAEGDIDSETDRRVTQLEQA